MCARGMTTRDMQAQLQELYGVEVSPTLISNVTEAVMEEVRQWQSRPLEAIYPIVYLDCLVVKVKENQRVSNKAVYLALGVTLSGNKELLGMWLSQNEGAKFWLAVLTELQNRGVKDIFIARVDGLTGFPEAIESVFPQTRVQLCMVHMVRNSLRYVSHKHMQAVATDLKAIYSSATEGEAELNLELKAREMGWALSQYQQVLADSMGTGDPAVRLSRRYSPRHLHDQRHRVAQYDAAQGHHQPPDFPLR